MTASLTAVEARIGQNAYVRDLKRAFERRRVVGDPDYALAQDEDVYDVLRRDPETAHAMQYRRHLGAASRWRVVPASDRDVDRAAAAWTEEALLRIRRFASARLLLLNAIFRGSAWAAVQGRWQTTRLGGIEGKWWVPELLKDVDKRRFRLSTDGDGRPFWELWSVQRGAWEPLGNRRKWFVRLVHEDSEESLHQGAGLTEAIYHWQYAKARVLSEGLAGVERWAQGVVHAAIDGIEKPGSAARSTAATASDWLDAIENMRSRHALVHDKVDELNMIDGPSTGHQMVTEFLAYLTSGIRILILGSNLPTEATEGGSYALAAIQENSTEALVQHDRELLGEALTHDLIGTVWDVNRAPLQRAGLAGAERPRFELVHEKHRDPNASAAAVATLIGVGVEGLREDEVFSAVGFTPAGPADRPLRVKAPAQGGTQPPESELPEVPPAA